MRQTFREYVEEQYDFRYTGDVGVMIHLIAAISNYLERELLAVEEAQADTTPDPITIPHLFDGPIGKGTTTLDMLLSQYPWLAETIGAAYDRGYGDHQIGANYDPRRGMDTARVWMKDSGL